MKSQNISKIVLLASMVVAVAVLVLFFIVGFDTPSETVMDKNEPKLTGLLIFTMYAYTGILALLTIANLVLAVTKFHDGGLINVITYCGGSIVLYLLFRYIICSGQEAPEGAAYTGTDMAIADAYIWVIGILFLAAVASAVVCATGVLSKSAIKK